MREEEAPAVAGGIDAAPGERQIALLYGASRCCARIRVHVPTERRLILGNRYRPVSDEPDWVSLDVRTSSSSPTGPGCRRRRPSGSAVGRLTVLASSSSNTSATWCSASLDIRPVTEPNRPWSRRAAAHGADAPREVLAALPFSVVLSDEVEAACEIATGRQSAVDVRPVWSQRRA